MKIILYIGKEYFMNTNSLFNRTDKAIRQAFINILKVTPFDKIKIQDILDETPVSRGTFYTHYRDKYEIAEKMQEQFLEERKNHRSVLKKMHKSSVNRNQIFQTFPESNQELYKTLLKIHTTDVNLRKAIAQDFENEYIEEMGNRKKDTLIEARLYAQLRTELEVIINIDEDRLTFERFIKIMKNVSSHILSKVE